MTSRKGHLLFGGKPDCGNLQDVWALEPATAAWKRILPSTTGESCERSGKQNCTNLCY
jgi:hypothetical protein